MEPSAPVVSAFPTTICSINPPQTYEEKLYVILRSIEFELIQEYLESFGLDAENLPIGLNLKKAADSMPRQQFVQEIVDGKLPFFQLSPIEIEVLHQGANSCGNIDAECPALPSAKRF